jgi:valyl-tRNA synthetase
VIKDEAIDMEFGTGVMTITPWHDQVDFAIAEKHNLAKEQVIDERGKLLPIAGEFAGMHISKARALIVEKLKAKGLVEKIEENYKHTVRTCYKCGTTIEPQIKSQWFIRMKPLAEKALEKIKAKEIRYIPDHYEKITTHWLSNIVDWNISRQIVWGIPIPAKICNKCEEGFVDLHDKITKCSKCGGEVRKDNDTFDTWFSSGQWPYATLGFPDSKDFKNYYPTDVMETAGEIIFFWVSRMIMLGLYMTGKLPFSTVYLHGLVLDGKGQKMSKSKGNVINPLEYMEKYGTDAFRMGIVIGNTPGTSLALSEEKIKAYKLFANKLWNVTRFILTSVGEMKVDKSFTHWSEKDKEYNERFSSLKSEVTKEMDEFKFYMVAEKLYSYVWHELASVILEDSKKVFKEGSESDKKSRNQFLLNTLNDVLILLHPFMPFITEEIWTDFPKDDSSKGKILMIQKWPE